MAYDTSWRTSPVYFGKDREVWTNSTNADKSGNSRNNFNPSTDESAKFHLAMDMLTLDPIVHVIDWGIYIDNWGKFYPNFGINLYSIIPCDDDWTYKISNIPTQKAKFYHGIYR